eukprot:TRINITY_DN7512_c0_g2_i3.p1 TRINITY_DN7512_c0_g2~~TRINITY_DN7512_c0_g2_i3.p1  ORF type:complete len:256 (-),score=42.36 TRINITY_DN7512_c0_g2_i3:109-876(-)
MELCTANHYWWYAPPFHSQLVNPSISLRSLTCRTAAEEIGQFFSTNGESPSIARLLRQSCVLYFREEDDDFPCAERRWDIDVKNGNFKSHYAGIRFGPWAESMLERDEKGLKRRDNESTGGPSGGGNDKDDDDGGGGGGDDDSEDHLFMLPFLTLAFAAFHLGYCIAVWIKHDKLDSEFLRTGFGLFCLLVIAAIRLNRHAGIDAYILGLGSSVGVMVWAGERWIIKKETNPAAILALSAASIGVMFTIAIYHNV